MTAFRPGDRDYGRLPLTALTAMQAFDLLNAKAVDTVFPLSEADAALKKIAAGGSRGKTILTVS